MHYVQLRITNKFVIVNQAILAIHECDVMPLISVAMHHVAQEPYARIVKARSNVPVAVD